MRYKSITVFIAAAVLIACAACGPSIKNTSGSPTVLFNDSAGRKVELPQEVTRVAPSGPVATMILATLCPEYMVCISSTPSSGQYKYLPTNLIDLPTTGQLYGSRSTINFEALISADPQLIIDLGDRKENIDSDMDALQKKTGIATVYIEADLEHISGAYRSLGQIFGFQERAEAIASFIDGTMIMAAENSSRISEDEMISVMYTSGTSGLNTNAYGSVQSQVLEIVGVKNAIVVDDISNQGGGNTIGLEQLYNFDPEVILFSGGSIYNTVSGMEAWAGLSAIKNDKYYEIPYLPYSWLSNPPSLNMVIGVWWLGNLIYPDIYDYDVASKAMEFYNLFWGYELTAAEADDMLANSTLKAMGQGAVEQRSQIG